MRGEGITCMLCLLMVVCVVASRRVPRKPGSKKFDLKSRSASSDMFEDWEEDNHDPRSGSKKFNPMSRSASSDMLEDWEEDNHDPRKSHLTPKREDPAQYQTDPQQPGFARDNENVYGRQLQTKGSTLTRGCVGCNDKCAQSPCCDPTGANSPANQQKTTQLAQEAACEAQAAVDAQQAAGQQASHQVKAQLAEKACQASIAAQAALAGKQAMVDLLSGQLEEMLAQLALEKTELGDSDGNEGAMKQAICAAQQLAKNMELTAQQAEKLVCILIKIDTTALEVEDEEGNIESITQHLVDKLQQQVDDARRDLDATCNAAKQAAASAQASRQNAMECCGK